MESAVEKNAKAVDKRFQSTSVYEDDNVKRLDRDHLVSQDSILMENDVISQQLKELLSIKEHPASGEESSPERDSGTTTSSSTSLGYQASADFRNSPPKCCGEGKYIHISTKEKMATDKDENGEKSSGSFGFICNIEEKEHDHVKDNEFVPPNDEMKEKIMKEAEALFSDFNILKDSFLQKHVRRSKDGYISIKLVTSFRRIRALTKNWKVVQYCLQDSQKLKLNETGTKVRRVDPIPCFEDTVYAKTVAVFNLPPDNSDAEYICDLMSHHGEVDCVTVIRSGTEIPEICTKRFLCFFKVFVTNKDFALVEYHRYESAKEALSKHDGANGNELKVVPVISSEYKIQSKPTSAQKNSAPKKEKIISDVSQRSRSAEFGSGKNSPSKRVTLGDQKSKHRGDTDNTKEIESGVDSSNISDSSGRRSGEEDAEFIPPSEELTEKIMKQAEEWFSDFNIFKANFLLNYIRRSKNGYVSVKLIASSRKMKALTKDWRAVQYSIGKSKKLILHERGYKVRRLDPIPKFEDTVYAKIVVVFNLSADNFGVENVRSLLSGYGTIVNLTLICQDADIPEICTKRFLTIHSELVKNKPFAIVEFQNYGSAIKAVSEQENTNNDDNQLKIVHLMSDAYRGQSGTSSWKRGHKGAKPTRAGSKGRRKQIRSLKKSPFSRKRFETTENTKAKIRQNYSPNQALDFNKNSRAQRSSKADYDTKKSASISPNDSMNSKGVEKNSGEKPSGVKLTSHFFPTATRKHLSAEEDLEGAGSSKVAAVHRVRVDKAKSQYSSAASWRSSLYPSVHHMYPFMMNNIGRYYELGLDPFTSRMLSENQYHPSHHLDYSRLMEQPWSMSSEGNQRFQGRNRSVPFWLGRASREFDRWHQGLKKRFTP